MGIFHSKVAPAEKKVKNQQLDDSLDPRSPTVNINRSPISPVGLEIALEKPTLTKVRDLTADLAELLDNAAQTPDRVGGAPPLPPPMLGEKLQSVLDPRSPGLFARTPLVLDDSGVSTAATTSIISLQATSLEYEEISYVDEGEDEEEVVVSQGEQSLSFKDFDEAISVVVSEAGSLFSDTSLNTELKADIDCIIQKLYEAGSDPRSPSIDIQRTPIVFEEVLVHQAADLKENESDEKADEHVSLPMKEETEKSQESKTNTTLTIIHQDENQHNALTPKPKEKGDKTSTPLGASGTARTPLGCVTNTPGKLGVADMRKTALFGQMKQNASSVTVAAAAAAVVNSAETIPGKKLKPRSRIPTLRMK